MAAFRGGVMGRKGVRESETTHLGTQAIGAWVASWDTRVSVAMTKDPDGSVRVSVAARDARTDRQVVLWSGTEEALRVRIEHDPA